MFRNILLIKLVNYFEPSIITRYNSGYKYIYIYIRCMYLKYTLDRFSMSYCTASTGKSPTIQTCIPWKQCSLYSCVMYYMQ